MFIEGEDEGYSVEELVVVYYKSKRRPKEIFKRMSNVGVVGG